MNHVDIFITQWVVDVTETIQFRAWGKDATGNKICVHVDDFTPFLYICPNIDVESKLDRLFGREKHRMPVNIEDVCLPKLYFAQFEDGARKTWDCARCYFNSNADFRYIANVFEKKKYLVFEKNIPPLLQFICDRGLKTVGWHRFFGFRRTTDLATLADQEWDTTANQCFLIEEMLPFPPFNICSFDIEAYSSVSSRMPRADVSVDVIFQISVVSRERSILLHIKPAMEIPGVECVAFETETDLLLGFVDLVRRSKPDFLLGYNTLGFDFKYIIDRCQTRKCFAAVQNLTLNLFKHAEVDEINWSSSAFKNQQFTFVTMEGIVIIDMLPIVRRDYKLDSYKLDAVVGHFISAAKDDVTPQFLFRAWKEQHVGNLTKVGKYCIHDSLLVLQLFEKLQTLNTMIEMAALSFINMFDTFARGQQLKVFSQIYRHCFKKIMVDTMPSTGEPYVGARVFDPVPQLTTQVVSFDFESLYPSVICNKNICYYSFVTDDSVPDTACHVLEWEDHQGCEHDEKWARKMALKGLRDITPEARREREELTSYKPPVICQKRRFRFLRDENESVVPNIIKTLLAQRKAAKADMKKYDSHTFEYMVLNARQLALKLSANSIYGFFGVAKGFLPFLPAAMSITFLGRETVLRAADIIKNQFGADILYGDTDSVYCRFKASMDIPELWKFAQHVAASVTAQFSRPLNLQFEDAIYTKYLLLSKKRYIYRSCASDGIEKAELGKKGCMLVRRDNCRWAKNVYADLINMIFDNATQTQVSVHLVNAIVELIGQKVPLADLVITKSIGDNNDGKISATTEDGKLRVGDYKIPMNTDAKMQTKGAKTEQEYIYFSLPAQIQLAMRMRERGAIVENGSRIAYVVTDLDNWRGKSGAKIEDVVFYQNNKWWLKLDYLYYINSLVKPLDKLFWLVYRRDGVMKKLFKTCVAKYNLLEQLKKPRIQLK